MKKNILILSLIILLASTVSSEPPATSNLDSLFINANKALYDSTLQARLGNTPNTINVGQIDDYDWESMFERNHIDPQTSDFWNKYSLEYEWPDIKEEYAYRIPNNTGEYSDYFIWIYKIVGNTKAPDNGAIIYPDPSYEWIPTVHARIGKMSDKYSEENIIKNFFLRDFQEICSLRLDPTVPWSCLLPQLDGSTITAVMDYNPTTKKYSLKTKYHFSFFKDLYWENNEMAVEYASKYNGLKIWEGPGGDIPDYSDYWIAVSDLYSKEVRFSIGQIKNTDKVEFKEEIPNNFIKFDCDETEIWSDDLVFTREEILEGKATKTCKSSDLYGTITVTVDSITNNGRTVSFKVKYEKGDSASHYGENGNTILLNVTENTSYRLKSGTGNKWSPYWLIVSKINENESKIKLGYWNMHTEYKVDKDISNEEDFVLFDCDPSFLGDNAMEIPATVENAKDSYCDAKELPGKTINVMVWNNLKEIHAGILELTNSSKAERHAGSGTIINNIGKGQVFRLIKEWSCNEYSSIWAGVSDIDSTKGEVKIVIGFVPVITDRWSLDDDKYSFVELPCTNEWGHLESYKEGQTGGCEVETQLLTLLEKKIHITWAIHKINKDNTANILFQIKDETTDEDLPIVSKKNIFNIEQFYKSPVIKIKEFDTLPIYFILRKKTSIMEYGEYTEYNYLGRFIPTTEGYPTADIPKKTIDKTTQNDFYIDKPYCDKVSQWDTNTNQTLIKGNPIHTGTAYNILQAAKTLTPYYLIIKSLNNQEMKLSIYEYLNDTDSIEFDCNPQTEDKTMQLKIGETKTCKCPTESPTNKYCQITATLNSANELKIKYE